MDIFEHIKDFYNFILDKSKTIGFKTGVFTATIFVLFVIDLITGFSFNYYINNKTTQLISINQLKRDYATDSIKTLYIQELEEEILFKKHYSYHLNKLYNDFHITNLMKWNEKKHIDQTTFPNNIESTTINKPIRNIFLMILSSSYVLVFMCVLMIFLPITDPINRDLKNILGVITIIAILSFFIAFFTWIAYQIPIVLNRPWINYILNLFLQSPFVYFMYFITKKN